MECNRVDRPQGQPPQGYKYVITAVVLFAVELLGLIFVSPAIRNYVHSIASRTYYLLPAHIYIIASRWFFMALIVARTYLNAMLDRRGVVLNAVFFGIALVLTLIGISGYAADWYFVDWFYSLFYQAPVLIAVTAECFCDLVYLLYKFRKPRGGLQE